MKSSIFILFMLMNSTWQSACVRYQVTYDVGVWVSKPSSNQLRDEKVAYTHTQEISTWGIAVFCGLTFLYYGGACWMYQAIPFDSDIFDGESEIRRDLERRYGQDGFDIEYADIRTVGRK